MTDNPANPGNEPRRRRAWHAPRLVVESDVAGGTGIVFSPKNYQIEPTPVNSTPKLPTS